MNEFLQFIRSNWAELLTLTREHIFLVFVSTGLAIALGVPLGILLTRIKSLRTPVLAFANIMQTVPSLALFGLLIPIPFIGGIGARTAIIALALYALLPVIRNTVTGILGIDPKVREAAVAMGMTNGQILKMVELPLAAPVMLTGIRVAVVISVGVATVAAAVGAGGLGTYIFRGLRQNDNNLLIAGALAAAILALLCDFALGQFEKSFEIAERATAGRRRFVALGVAAVLAAIVGVGYISNFRSEISNSGAKAEESRPVVVGSKDFTESIILAEILAQMLEKRGISVTRKFELGGNIAHESLLSNQIDVYPEYTGTAYTAILKHQADHRSEGGLRPDKGRVRRQIQAHVEPAARFFERFCDPRSRRRCSQEQPQDDLRRRAVCQWLASRFRPGFHVAGRWLCGFLESVRLRFRQTAKGNGPVADIQALASSSLDIIAGNSTDGLIAALDLVQLEDDRHYFPPYQAVYIARQDALPGLKQIFDKLTNAISTAEMRRLNYEVDGKKRNAPRSGVRMDTK